MRLLSALENLLDNLPRVLLLALAIVAARNPLVDGRFAYLAWYLRMPLEFVVLVLLALTAAQIFRVLGYDGDEPPTRKGRSRG